MLYSGVAKGPSTPRILEKMQNFASTEKSTKYVNEGEQLGSTHSLKTSEENLRAKRRTTVLQNIFYLVENVVLKLWKTFCSAKKNEQKVFERLHYREGKKIAQKQNA